jgi:hypothetical protein
VSWLCLTCGRMPCVAGGEALGLQWMTQVQEHILKALSEAEPATRKVGLPLILSIYVCAFFP